MIVTIIGSRETPPEVLEKLSILSFAFAKAGAIIRTGGADGADTAAEEGCLKADKSKLECHLPWKSFNKRPTDNVNYIVYENEEAAKLARKYHPFLAEQTEEEVLRRYKQKGGKESALIKLMARNVYQILGTDLKSPTDLVLCWTKMKGNVALGGTSQAIRIANAYGVPVINLYQE